MANGKCFGWNWLSSVSILCLAVCVCDRMKDDGICGRHLFYITRQLFLLFNVTEWTNTAMSPGAQVQGAASTSVASALINQSYEACKWQCLYIIPHTHTDTDTHTHTYIHTHRLSLTHGQNNTPYMGLSQKDGTFHRHTHSQDNKPWWVNSSCSILSAAVITTDMCSGTWPSSEFTSRICKTAQHLQVTLDAIC